MVRRIGEFSGTPPHQAKWLILPCIDGGTCEALADTAKNGDGRSSNPTLVEGMLWLLARVCDQDGRPARPAMSLARTTHFAPSPVDREEYGSIYQRKGGEMTLVKARRSRLAYLVAALALALSLVVIAPAPADAGVTCSNTFHFHGTGYWHERYYTYPSGNGWIWGWRNQNYDFIGSIWCGSQNP